MLSQAEIVILIEVEEKERVHRAIMGGESVKASGFTGQRLAEYIYKLEKRIEALESKKSKRE